MPQIKLTIPDDIYKIIKEKAKENYRTINNEINFRLVKTIEPGVNSTPYQLHYPEGVRSTNPIPETPYKITCDSTTKLKRRIIGGPEDETNKNIESTRSYTSTKTADGHKKHPLVWLDENNIDPNDISESAYNKLHEAYPDVEINEFVNYQHQRQNVYKPNPNDPYDPTINNPYLRNK